MALKWGIVSAGLISHDFVNALSTLPADEHQVIAVAARSLDSAQYFAKRFNIPHALGGYESLAKNKDIEIVYIGALHPAHYAISVLMLENGKHILCEKPLSMNEKQSKKLLDLAKSKKLFFMEAIWSRFFPSYQYVKAQIDAGVLGKIQEVNVEFGYDHKSSDRTEKKDLGAGTVLDQGVYAIQASQYVFQTDPIAIEATGVLNNEGIDTEMTCKLSYSNGGVTNMYVSSKKFLDNNFVIKGSKGTITVKQFWCPTSIIDVNGKEQSWTLPKAKLDFNYPNSVGLRYEAEAARKCIRAGLIECETVSHKESLLIARIQDEIRRQIGVSYPADFDEF